MTRQHWARAGLAPNTTIARILAAVEGGLETSAAIRDATGFERATVSARLNTLEKQGRVKCVGRVPSTRDPRAKRWEIVR